MDRMQHRRVRVLATLRTAHLERFHELVPASVLYANTSYDFDPTLLDGLDVHRFAGPWDLFRRLLAARIEAIEINEPLMLASTRSTLVALAAVRARGLVARRRVRVVAYAIENLDPFTSLQHRVRSRWRRLLFRALVRVVTGQLDRLAVGTDGALAAYRPYLRGRRLTTRLVPALPARCAVCPAVEPDDTRAGVVFVGAFDERKGVRQLLDAWPGVLEAHPRTTLHLLGKGPLSDLAERAARSVPGVTTTIDPSRRAIHEALRGAKVLVLLSRPSPTWREQLGLPILEGLAHGCEIVATDETGMAGWLAGHGHRVVAGTAGPDEVTQAVVDALVGRRTPADVVADLPPVDGRLAADRWMFSDGG
jgi:glycosyltransferase involved in cell wall biosynthesis